MIKRLNLKLILSLFVLVAVICVVPLSQNVEAVRFYAQHVGTTYSYHGTNLGFMSQSSSDPRLTGAVPPAHVSYYAPTQPADILNYYGTANWIKYDSTWASGITTASAADAHPSYLTTASTLTVRNAPNGGDTGHRLARGTRIIVLEFSGAWARFRIDQSALEGWVSTGFITHSGYYYYSHSNNTFNLYRRPVVVWFYRDAANATVSYSPNSSGWTNGNVSVAANVGTFSYGMAWRIRYSYDNGASYGGWSGYIYGTSTNPVFQSQGLCRAQIEVTHYDGTLTYHTSGTYHIDKTAPTVSANVGSWEWSSANAAVTLTYGDSGGSGVATTQYAWSTSTATPSSWSTYSSAVSQAGNGTWYLHARVVDGAGNVSTARFGPYKVDKTAPTISANISSRAWGSGDVSVTLTYADTGGSALSTKQYAWSTSTATPTSWTNYSTAVTRTTNGTWYLHVKATDGAGNAASNRFGPYYIDKDAASHVSHSITGANYVDGDHYWVKPNTPISIMLRGTDSSSGIAHSYIRFEDTGVDARAHHDWNGIATHLNYWSTHVSVDVTSATRSYNSGGTREITWGVTPKTHGYNYDVQYYYTDAAANTVGYTNTGMILRVDGTLPTVSLSPDSRSWINSNVSITVTAADADSGLKRWRERFSTDNGSTWGVWGSYKTASTGTLTLTQSGNVKVQIEAEDNVGNVRTHTSGQYNIDRTAPTISYSPNGHSSTGNFNVSVGVADSGGSGIGTVKHALTSSTAKPTTGWTTASGNFSVAINQIGTFYIHTEVEDNAGNITYTRSSAFTINNDPPSLTAGHAPNPTMIFMETTVNVRVSDPEGDTMGLKLFLVDPNGVETPVSDRSGLLTGQVVSFTFTPELTGQYVVKAILNDIYPVNTRTITYNLPVLDASVEGAIKHTDRWEENRQIFNISKTGNPESPRTYNFFFAGELFVIEAEASSSMYASGVKVSLLGTEFETELELESGDKWVGEMWDETMLTWKDMTLEFEFTVTYQNGYQKTDVQTVYIDSEKFFRMRRTS